MSRDVLPLPIGVLPEIASDRVERGTAGKRIDITEAEIHAVILILVRRVVVFTEPPGGGNLDCSASRGNIDTRRESPAVKPLCQVACMLERRKFLRRVAADPARILEVLGCSIKREAIKLVVPANSGFPRILIGQAIGRVAGRNPVNDSRNVRAASCPVKTDRGPTYPQSCRSYCRRNAGSGTEPHSSRGSCS